MRVLSDPQRTLSFCAIAPSAKKKWDKIDEILNACPQIGALVLHDLTTCPNGVKKKNTGNEGMSADAVLRFAIVKMTYQLSYRQLQERVDDSIVLRAFCGYPFRRIPNFRTIQENIKQVRPSTMEQVNAIIVQYAMKQSLEDGRDVRLDTTGVESNIHHPTDATLLWDVVRVVTRTALPTDAEGVKTRAVVSQLPYSMSEELSCTALPAAWWYPANCWATACI